MLPPYFPSILVLCTGVSLFPLLRNESYICLSPPPSYSHSIRELSVLLSPPFFPLPPRHKRRVFILLPSELLPSFLPPFASSSPYFLSPPCVSFSTSRRSRVKPSATTGPADEKEISSLSFSSFPFPSSTPYSIPISLFLSHLQHDCAWFCEGTTSPPSRARAPFLIFPGTIVSA